jgi:exopolysaccharide biosynthesis polyprenyl glycosylphosphotransferase
MRAKALVFLLFVGDIAALYAALFISLALRYGGSFYKEFVDTHAVPFTVLFIPWLIIFYVSGLYDLRRLRNNLAFLKTLALALAANAIFAALLFYLVPLFGIAPKTNLFIFFGVLAIIEAWWRRLFNRLTVAGEAPNRVLLVGKNPTASEVELTILENAQLGYTIAEHLAEETVSVSPTMLKSIVEERRVNLVVVPRDLKRKEVLAPTLYALFGQGIAIIDLDSFYEIVLRKVPLADVKETWFLENIEGAAKFYDQLKRAFELLLAAAIGISLLPFALLIAILIKLTSRGAVIYKQTRAGQNNKPFTLYKFRTMRTDAEKDGAQWAAKGDARVTPVGKILRASHLDELPQLWNIIRGDLSFVGPRPERPEFVGQLTTTIPFYEVRLLIKPGVTGWAQINHRADLTAEDVKQKLQYDIYYLKNRSLILDLAIVLKTLRSIFVNPE